MNERDVKVRIHGIDEMGSAGDGPGVRSVVFFQGCHRHCPGCHNPETWSPCGGTETTVGAIEDRLLAIRTRRMTISGGEPLEQLTALRALIARLNADGCDIALYTGGSKDEVPEDIARSVCHLKTGSFVQELRTTTKPFVGSSNQTFWSAS